MAIGREQQTSLIAEMAIIFVLTAALGVAWNHQLLGNAWHGRPTGTAPASPTTTTEAIPLPLGLMQVKELHDRQEATFVDARDRSAFVAGHIIGARSLPLGEVDKLLQKFRKEVPAGTALVIYCNGFDCHDSRDLGARLLKEGYRTVYVYEGGIPEWRDAGYPVAEGER